MFYLCLFTNVICICIKNEVQERGFPMIVLEWLYYKLFAYILSSLKIKWPVVLPAKVSLFANGRGNVIWNMQTMANHRQIQRKKITSLLYRKKKRSEVATLNRSALDESENWGWWWFLIAWTIARQRGNIPSSCLGSRVSVFLFRN